MHGESAERGRKELGRGERRSNGTSRKEMARREKGAGANKDSEDSRQKMNGFQVFAVEKQKSKYRTGWGPKKRFHWPGQTDAAFYWPYGKRWYITQVET